MGAVFVHSVIQQDRYEESQLKIQALSEEVSSLQENREFLIKENKALGKELNSVTSKLEEVQSENQELRTTVKKVKTSKKSLNKTVDKLKDKIEVLETESVSVKANVDSKDLQLLAKTDKKDSPEPVQESTSETNRTITVSATAYTAYCPGCSGVTYTGIDLRANPNAKVIAVDPDVIPLGSRVYVEGYGEAIAGDIGGAINGHDIDVFVSNKSEALQWGRKDVQVTILSSN